MKKKEEPLSKSFKKLGFPSLAKVAREIEKEIKPTSKSKKVITYWNYRVIKTADTKLEGLEQTYSWGIYEVYYKNDIPHSWSKDPMYPMGESWNDLYGDLNNMERAFSMRTLQEIDGKLIEIGQCK